MTRRATLLLPALLLLAACAASARAQDPPANTVEHEFPNGSRVVLAYDAGRLRFFNYYGSAGAGESMHECEMEFVRGDNSSTWEDGGAATTVRSGEGRRAVAVTVRRARGRYTITFAGSRKGSFCGAGVSLPRRITLTRRRGGDYAGRILM
ncbi:MAG TPA: hypothetical protein VER32_09565 [Pyrinomonadaceae bacterium]|nr:hypothetical protein [Pyrinomonadaceae bacterium]